MRRPTNFKGQECGPWLRCQRRNIKMIPSFAESDGKEKEKEFIEFIITGQFQYLNKFRKYIIAYQFITDLRNTSLNG